MTQAKTILVVDDDHELRSGLTTVLQRHGYRTLEADDGLAARELIEGHNPDLVIIDMMMPRWGGLAVLEHFQDKAGAPPFIMITANEGAKHKAYAEKIGVADYLHKPFPMDRLLARVGEKLGAAAPEAPAAEAPTNPATLRCRCRMCGARIKAPRQLFGQRRPCPNCKLELLIYPEPPEDEGPMLAQEDFQRGPTPPRRGWC